MIVLRYRERKHKILGIEAPDKHELTGKDGGPIDYGTGTGALGGKLGRLATPAATEGVPHQTGSLPKPALIDLLE
jgi:hypothetical protein